MTQTGHDAFQLVDDALGHGLADFFGPFAVFRHVDLASSITAQLGRHVLHLHPQYPFAFRRTAGVQRARLANSNSELGRDQAVIGLGHAHADVLQAVGHVQQRYFQQLWIAPVRHAVQRQMNLHVATAKAVGISLFTYLSGSTRQQTTIELWRCNVTHHMAGFVDLAAGTHATGFLSFQHNFFHFRVQLNTATSLFNNGAQSTHQILAATFHHGHATGHHSRKGQLADQGRAGVVRAQARVQDPGSHHAAHTVIFQFTVSPAAEGFQGLASVLDHAVHAALAPLREQQTQQATAVWLGAQQAEGQARIALKQLAAHGTKGIAITSLQAIDTLNGIAHIVAQGQAFAIAAHYAGGVAVFQKLHALGGQIVFQTGIGSAGCEQGVPGRQQLMGKARKQLLGTDTPARTVVTLQHQDLLALLRQQGCTHQGVNATAHHNDGIRFFIC